MGLGQMIMVVSVLEISAPSGFVPVDIGITDGWRELFCGMCVKCTSVVLRDGLERNIAVWIGRGREGRLEERGGVSRREDIDDDGSEFEEECCENGHVYICFEVRCRGDSFPVDDAKLRQNSGSCNI